MESDQMSQTSSVATYASDPWHDSHERPETFCLEDREKKRLKKKQHKKDSENRNQRSRHHKKKVGNKKRLNLSSSESEISEDDSTFESDQEIIDKFFAVEKKNNFKTRSPETIKSPKRKKKMILQSQNLNSNSKETPLPNRQNERPTKNTVQPKEKKKSQKKSNAQKTIELKANEILRLDARIRQLWTDFKDQTIQSLAQINEGFGHRLETRINRVHFISQLLINMSSYEPERLNGLPLLKELFARNDLGPKLIDRFRSPSAILPSEKNSDLNHIFEQIKNELNNNQQFLSPKQSDLKKINKQVVSMIGFLQSKIGVELIYPRGLDPEREQTDLKLLYAKAAFNQLILNSYQTKECAARLKWFDKSGWLRGQLRSYLQKEFSSLQERQSSEVERIKLACKKLMDMLDIEIEL